MALRASRGGGRDAMGFYCKAVGRMVYPKLGSGKSTNILFFITYASGIHH